MIYRIESVGCLPNKRQQEEMRSVKDHFAVKVFVMNVESSCTKKGQTAGA